ncbi:MAG: DUF3990 domain-containing protein [Oscillospiraceae bacterium]|jgi:hypothetical protein|nr:DUF3990 domain-containing protein [Oscillospiraceae bacterium]
MMDTETMSGASFTNETVRAHIDIENKAAKNGKLLLYHGSPVQDFEPFYGGGRDYHDYGKGLYCVYGTDAGLGLAKEWACQHEDHSHAYIYIYEFEYAGINPKLILNLSEYEPIYWLSVLARHRYSANETNIQRQRRLRMIEMFPVDFEQYEIIKGWRANDKYYAFLSLFLSEAISYEAVKAALGIGDLGYQFVIKGEGAYKNCKRIGIIPITSEEYADFYKSYHEKDEKSRQQLNSLRDIEGKTLNQILSEGGL